MKKFISLFFLAILLLGAILLWQPAPIDPIAYNPSPKPELKGVLAPNNLLQKAELLALAR